MLMIKGKYLMCISRGNKGNKREPSHLEKWLCWVHSSYMYNKEVSKKVLGSIQESYQNTPYPSNLLDGDCVHANNLIL